jgi:MFS family permease
MSIDAMLVKEKSMTRAWVITIIGSLFFFYSFIQANMMTPLNKSLLDYFSSSASGVAVLGAWFFYADVFFLLPAGLLLDRFSVKKIMLVNMALVVMGTLLFAFSTSIIMASFARFLSGIMMSFGLIACLKLASFWLPANRMAIASSIVITIGMVGGMVAQTPITILINNFEWRGAVFAIAVLGAVVTFVLMAFVKMPSGVKEESTASQENVFVSLSKVMKLSQNWYAGLFTSLLNMPVAILGALFGISYLTTTYNISDMQAASIVSMLFLGMIIGSPFFGWFSDSLKVRKFPMLVGSSICLILTLVLLNLNTTNVTLLYVLFLSIGFTSAAQVLGYPIIAESNPSKISGTALSLAAILIMGGGYGIGLPLVGKLLDRLTLNFSQTLAYKYAFLTMPIGIVVSMIMILFMKETRCQSINK